MRSACISLAFALFAAQPLLAQSPVDKKVDCDKGDTISKAVFGLDVDKSYVIHVSGTCKENVLIENFEGISLTILGDPSAIVQGFSVSPAGPPVFLITNSRRVILVNLTISTSGGITSADNPAGVAMRFCRGCEVSNSIVNSSRVGVNLGNSQAAIANVTVNSSDTASSGISMLDSSDAEITNFTAHGNGGGNGVSVDRASHARLTVTTLGTSSIHNYGVGIKVGNASSVEAGAPCSLGTCLEVHDNVVAGVQVVSAQAVLQGLNVTNNTQGVVVTNAGTLTFIGSGSITGGSGGFGGVGILVTHNSHAAVFGSMTGSTSIDHNSGRGVAVASNSSVQFDGPAASVSVVSNNGLINIACDASSLITGTSSLAATTISCLDQQPSAIVIP
jgi:hypothetical protein